MSFRHREERAVLNPEFYLSLSPRRRVVIPPETLRRVSASFSRTVGISRYAVTCGGRSSGLAFSQGFLDHATIGRREFFNHRYLFATTLSNTPAIEAILLRAMSFQTPTNTSSWNDDIGSGSDSS